MEFFDRFRNRPVRSHPELPACTWAPARPRCSRCDSVVLRATDPFGSSTTLQPVLGELGKIESSRRRSLAITAPGSDLRPGEAASTRPVDTVISRDRFSGLPDPPPPNLAYGDGSCWNLPKRAKNFRFSSDFPKFSRF